VEVEPATLDARLPTMVLQPLVENAIRHGIARDPTARVVEVRATRANGSLRIEVMNDGPSPAEQTRPEGQAGLGLANTRARLGRLYGAAGRLTLGAGAGGGTVAVLEVPWRAQA
jgi:LytS/YehU family sensor histidine kinase